MHLIKYYSPHTCYDGAREFERAPGIGKPETGKRFYPDEFLIAELLRSYRLQRYSSTENKDRQAVIVTEPWKNDTLRGGGANTLRLNAIIMQSVKAYSNSTKNTLLLVPFLYGYHHPGIAIDIKNKKAVYIDPFGSPAGYAEAAALIEQLKSLNFDCRHVSARQQMDGKSCGPILTASLMQFMDDFMHEGVISEHSFAAHTPRKNLATLRFSQMYINNFVDFSTKPIGLLSEIMLADEQMWLALLQERGIESALSTDLVKVIRQQRKDIEALPKLWQDIEAYVLLVKSIVEFQSRMTEVFLLNSQKEATKKIASLLVAYPSLPQDELFTQFAVVEQNLFSSDHWNKTAELFGLAIKVEDRAAAIIAAPLSAPILAPSVATVTGPVVVPLMNSESATASLLGLLPTPEPIPLSFSVATINSEPQAPATIPEFSPTEETVFTSYTQPQSPEIPPYASPLAPTTGTDQPQPAAVPVVSPGAAEVSLPLPNSQKVAALALIQSEILRLEGSKKEAGNLWVLLGVLEASNAKVTALTELQKVVTEKFEHSQELSVSLGGWKQNYGACIAVQRNRVHRFFAVHTATSDKKVEELLTQLQTSI